MVIKLIYILSLISFYVMGREVIDHSSHYNQEMHQRDLRKSSGTSGVTKTTTKTYVDNCDPTTDLNCEEEKTDMSWVVIILVALVVVWLVGFCIYCIIKECISMRRGKKGEKVVRFE